MSGKYPGNIITTGADTGYSAYFDGTGDFLNVADNAAFELTGDFTIEGWFYLTNTVTTEQDLVTKWYASGNFSYLLYVLSGSLRFAWSANGGTTNSISGGTVSLNTWFHAAISGNAASGTIRLFLNGVQVATQSTVTFYTSGTSPVYIMADNNGGTPIYTRGYASNVRILKGTNLYTAAFTPPTQLLNITNTSLLTCNSPAIVDQSTANSGSGFTVTTNGDAKVSTFTPFVKYQAYNPALGSSTPGIWTVSEALQAAATRQWNMYDPYFRDTVLALRTSSTDGLQNNQFLDSSSNNFTITRNGNTTQGTFTPFSQTGWSYYFSADTDYLTNTNAAFAFGTGDFEISFYLYKTGTANAYVAGTSNATGSWGIQTSSTAVDFRVNNLASAVVSGAISINQWNKIRFVRTSSVLYLYVNDALLNSAASTTNLTGTGFALGSFGQTTNVGALTSYISNFRVVKAGTEVLNTALSNRFVDTSPSPLSLAVAGVPSVQAFGPINTNTAYTPELHGGSGYFDRTTDYLDVGSNSNLTIGTSNFTIAMWVYFNVIDTTSQVIFDGRPSSVADNVTPLIIYSGVTNSFQYRVDGTGEIVGTGSVTKAGQWYYIVVSRLSGTTRMFVNGAQQGSNYTDGSNYVAFASDRPRIADRGNSSGAGLGFSGYISGLQVLVGTGSSSSTVPTAPPTNIANTKLLLNFTNAGIFDATGKNNLETVGNAQASVAVRNTRLTPAPATSMYFDGTGDWLDFPVRGTDFGSSNFTIELWFYKLSTGGQRLVSARANNDGLTLGVNSSNFLTTFYGDTTAVGSIVGTTTIAINTWYHVALVRSGGTATLYLNGVVEGTPTSWSAKSFTSTAYRVGSSLDSRNEYFNGYISDLRITRYARYTGKFTPPTSLTQNQ